MEEKPTFTKQFSVFRHILKFTYPHTQSPKEDQVLNSPKISTLLDSGQFLVFILLDLSAWNSPVNSKFIYPNSYFNISTWMSNRHLKHMFNIDFLEFISFVHSISHLVNSIFSVAQAKNLDYISLTLLFLLHPHQIGNAVSSTYIKIQLFSMSAPLPTLEKLPSSLI